MKERSWERELGSISSILILRPWQLCATNAADERNGQK